MYLVTLNDVKFMERYRREHVEPPTIECDTIAQALRVVADEMDGSRMGESSTIRVFRGESGGRMVGMPGLYWIHEHKLWRQVVVK